MKTLAHRDLCLYTWTSELPWRK